MAIPMVPTRLVAIRLPDAPLGTIWHPERGFVLGASTQAPGSSEVVRP